MSPKLVLATVGCLALGGLAAVGHAQVGPQPPEPALDQGLVLGQVFCDADGDGRLGRGEVGLGGVRVVADHGWEVRSDRHGSWHLRRLTSGVHLVKVDETTLPPGASLPAGPRLILRIDSGLPEPVSVPVLCRFESAAPETVEAPPGRGEVIRAAIDQPLPLVTVGGRVDRPWISVDGREIPEVEADLALVFPEPDPERGLNMPWRPGPLAEPLRFRTLGRADQPVASGLAWRFLVSRVTPDGERTVRELFGRGEPPRELSWDGTEPGGAASLLDAGAVYKVRLVVTDGAGRAATSPVVTFGVSYGDAALEIERKVLRGRVLDSAGRPILELRRALKRLRKVFKRNPGARLLIEVHTDDSALPDIALARTRKSAFLTSVIAEKTLRLSPARVMALGYGGMRPLKPNLTEKDRRFNRRVELTVLPPERPDALLPIPNRQLKAAAVVQGLDAVLGADDTFVRAVARPTNGLLQIRVVGRRGHRLDALVDLATLPALPPDARALEDPLRRFGGAPLREALGDPLIGSRDPAEVVTAGDLEVWLPPRGELARDKRLFVAGRTHASNTLRINGRAAAVDPDGRFGEVVPLVVGTNTLTVETVDRTGHRAQVQRAVEVTTTQFFLLALADGAVGELDAHLRGRGETTSIEAGPVFLQGRGAAYFKGRISGTVLAEDLFLTAHVDSAKREPFHAFYEQVIDPAREYTVFGDTADDQPAARARGPFYVLVEADGSRLQLANERVDIQGVELLRYDRALYGALLDFDRAFAPGWDTRVKAFVSDDVMRLRRGHDELRATGGSLYYLSARDVLDGSERLTVVIREADTRLELDRRELTRDRDYRIDYQDGRVFLKAPLSSRVDALSSIGGFQPLTGRDVLAGHEVWLVADYETPDRSDGASLAAGAHASQRLFDMVEVGGGYVQEVRAGEDYQLYGGHVAVDFAEGSRAVAEVAGSRGVDGVTRLSDDGGLSFDTLDRSGGRRDGLAWKVGLDSHIGQLVGLDEGDLDLRVRGWWHLEEAGFHAQGHAQDQASERFGAEAVYRPTPDDEVRIRFDGTTTLLADDRFTGGLRAVKRFRYGARYRRLLGPVSLHAEGAFGQHRDDAVGAVMNTGVVAAGATWRILPELQAHLGHQAVIGGDDAVVGSSLLARQSTSFGVDWQALDDLALSVGHVIRWDGDHAIRLGVRSQIDERTSAYLEERLMPGGGKAGSGPRHATVLGTESRLDGGGRAWGEYRIGDAISGSASQAVVGIGRRFELVPGFVLDGAYERVQTFGAGEGSRSRDVVSTGLEITALGWLKFGGRYELRWDRGQGLERVQAVILNGLTARIGRDLSLMASFDYTLTQNLTNRDIEREGMEASLALLWRPRTLEWLTLAARYGRVQRRGLRDLDAQLADPQKLTESATADLASVAAIFELPLRLRLTEKLTLRHRTVLDPEAGDAVTLDLLWASRLGFHLVAGLDIDLGGLHHGALAEVGYTLFEYVRLAVGYDFTDIPRELDADATPGRGGVYARITGTY